MRTLANSLGTTEHFSPLLRKARGLGLRNARDLVALAVARGCRHYGGRDEAAPAPPVSEAQFNDEELAIALLSPCLPYDPRTLRVGAQMLGRRGNRPRELALLARKERAQSVARCVAEAGRQTEPREPFWSELLAHLSSASRVSPEPPAGVMPHPSRFRSETGLTNPRNSTTRGGPQRVWLRPLDHE